MAVAYLLVGTFRYYCYASAYKYFWFYNSVLIDFLLIND